MTATTTTAIQTILAAQPEPPIDLMFTWGEWGNIFKRLAFGGQLAEAKTLLPDLARAMAAAQALRQIMDTLNEEQSKVVSKTLCDELKKQGY
jgi:hypothetical protein